MKVVIVGAGIVGAAAAWALVRDGHEVRILEQFELEHARGSSHGRSRIFRLAYPQRAWVELAREALAGWRGLERECGDRLLELDGLLELVEDLAVSSRAALECCGVACDVVDPGRFGVAVPEGWTALLQPEAGIVLADRARRAFLRGLRVETGSRVERLEAVEADAVVVAAGPWARKLLAASGIELPVRETRETFAYFRHKPAVGAVVDRDAHGHLIYAVRDPLYGLKAGAHMAGPEADPDDEPTVDADVVEKVAAWVGKRFPGADVEPVAAETCFYTTTTDESFVLERHGRILVASACSGHGFKFAPMIGRRIADIL
ncbi:MAG: FAD-dependent oxidoreductase [Gaiellaceae bacterium]